MSIYTTTVRWIVDELGKPYFTPQTKSIHDKIVAACPAIFNFDFPIWDENHRLALETGIIRHYYMREIAFETVALWQFFLEQDLNELMPYYNKLYETTTKDFDYLNPTYIQEELSRDVSETTDSKGQINAKGNSNQTATANNTNQHNFLSSDLPQATINPNVDYANRKTQEDLSSNDSSTTNASSDSSSDSTNHYDRGLDEKTRRSRIGNLSGKSQTELLLEYRNAIIVVDSLIINALDNLFFTLF